MAGGSIDDILARISRIEQAGRGPSQGGHADQPAREAPSAPRRDAAPPPSDESERDDDDDGVDLITPETYRGDGADDAGDDSPATPGMLDIEPDLPEVDDKIDDDEAMLRIEPEQDDEDPLESFDAMASIEPESAEAIETADEAGAEIDTFTAMTSIDTGPEPAPTTRSERFPPTAQADEEDDEPWIIGRDGLKPRSQSTRAAPAEPERTRDAPASRSAAQPERAAPLDDGMISINPGGASSTGMSDLFTPDSRALATTNSFADILESTGAVTREQIAAAERVAQQTPGKDLAIVLREQGVDEEAVQTALAKHHDLPFERIDPGLGLEGAIDGTMLQRLGLPFCAEYMVLPLRKEGSRVVIAATRPNAAFELDEIRRRLNCGTPKLVLATESDITSALELAGFGAEERAAQENVDLSEILEDVDEADVTVEKREEQTVDLEQKAGESPVIRYVNYIIQTAVREGASDIHIEPAEKKITVRLRVDGVLYESMNPPANMAAAITSRIKIMANLDISERRIPQDGRIRCTVQGRKLDLRVSTLPSSYGEKVVMRILDTKSINVQLEDLGFDEQTLEIWKHQVKQAHGIVLVTGPTGSGKTTTLYSSLRQLDKNRLNISTAEDPVEYHLDGITQTQTHEKIGMSFARVLKALLRQDPDVIMVGEIRDHETAHIAVQAALTGHLVLSTLHTNDAPSSITRLVNIGLEPFLVGAAVNAVLAQRLVRRLCPHCKELRDPPREQIEFLELSGIIGQQVYMPVGCDRCRQTGYSGRVGIYELLAVDDQLRDIIARNPNVSEFRRMCLERGMQSLRQDGMSKVADGLTTVAEVLRVTTDH